MARVRKTWLAPAEMAAFLGVSKSAVYGRVKTGSLEGRKEHGRLVVRLPAGSPASDGTLSRREVAAMLGTHPNSVGPLVSAGELSAVRRRGVLHFRKQDVEAYLESCRVEPGTLPWARQ